MLAVWHLARANVQLGNTKHTNLLAQCNMPLETRSCCLQRIEIRAVCHVDQVILSSNSNMHILMIDHIM